MLALAHAPIQPSERDCPPGLVRTPSSSNTANRPRIDAIYRERERERERERNASLQMRRNSTTLSTHRARTEQTQHRAPSPTLHPREEPVRDEPMASNLEPPINFPATEAEKTCLDIHNYPAADLLKLLASLLQQIASSNDRLRPQGSHLPCDSTHPPSPTPLQRQEMSTLTSASQEAFSTPTSSLTFHARHIPSISLEAYLLRILKYCPTSNEVFLSLLVYFDRMSKLSSDTTGKDLVIDSYNIHRLVIAGVTVASKFFSDVFYTNSRYAKVGGLPQPELNQLELQFLLLNNFHLTIPASEMHRYAMQLIAYSHGSFSSIPSPFVPNTETVSERSNNESSAGSEQLAYQQDADEGDSYDTEDETIRPTHSTCASETSSLATAQSDVEEDEDDDDSSRSPVARPTTAWPHES